MQAGGNGRDSSGFPRSPCYLFWLAEDRQGLASSHTTTHAPQGTRTQSLPTSTRPRRHTGCENCDPAYSQLAPGMSPSPKAPLEYRLEWGVPAEIAPGSVRPVIGALPADLPRGA